MSRLGVSAECQAGDADGANVYGLERSVLTGSCHLHCSWGQGGEAAAAAQSADSRKQGGGGGASRGSFTYPIALVRT